MPTAGAVIYPAQFRDDAALLAALQAGEAGATRELYDRHASTVRRVLARVMGADPELPDLLHDTFVQALRSVSSVRDGSRLRPWLASVAVHTARGRIRRRTRLSWLGYRAPEQLPVLPSPQADPEVLEALRTTYEVLDKLSTDLRIPFALRFIDQMELTEVAEACGVSLATIKRRLARAEKRFVTLARHEPALAPWLEHHPRWRNL